MEEPVKARAGLDREDLMDRKVASVAKHEEPLLDAPAAVSVLVAGAIRRSGDLTQRHALRLVPGHSEAQSDSVTWRSGPAPRAVDRAGRQPGPGRLRSPFISTGSFRLSCSSEVGKGTTFVVRLPARPGMEEGADRAGDSFRQGPFRRTIGHSSSARSARRRRRLDV
jgi:hypothetical protein